MTKVEQLQTRLNEIGQSLAATPRALALIGLGSAGADAHRLDDFSDLDFFVIVEAGAKQAFLTDLQWLSSIRPIAYLFRNTVDGYKLLFDDDIFCEFAIFDSAEFATAAFTAARIIWMRPEAEGTLPVPSSSAKPQSPVDVEWSINEALTNLYVGLGRHHRGEVLSASRFIQQYAVDRIIQISSTLETEQGNDADPFMPERRFENRFPSLAQHLPTFVQGYSRNRESALAILQFLEQHFEISAPLAARIRALTSAPVP